MGRLTRGRERLPGPLPLPLDDASREERRRRVRDIEERLARDRYRVGAEAVADSILREWGVRT